MSSSNIFTDIVSGEKSKVCESLENCDGDKLHKTPATSSVEPVKKKTAIGKDSKSSKDKRSESKSEKRSSGSDSFDRLGDILVKGFADMQNSFSQLGETIDLDLMI